MSLPNGQAGIAWEFSDAFIVGLMFIGPCIIVIVENKKTNLMSLAVFISLLMRSTCFGH
jgi:hypothetical protein